jgi:hypothetical protein
MSMPQVTHHFAKQLFSPHGLTIAVVSKKAVLLELSTG